MSAHGVGHAHVTDTGERQVACQCGLLLSAPTLPELASLVDDHLRESEETA